MVIIKAHQIGIRKKETYLPWSIQEETLLKKLYPDNSFRDIASQIGRSVPAVGQRTHRLGLRKVSPVWSKKELNLLKRLYPSKTAEEISNRLNRSSGAVRQKIFRLGLRKR